MNRPFICIGIVNVFALFVELQAFRCGGYLPFEVLSGLVNLVVFCLLLSTQTGQQNKNVQSTPAFKCEIQRMFFACIEFRGGIHASFREPYEYVSSSRDESKTIQIMLLFFMVLFPWNVKKDVCHGPVV